MAKILIVEDDVNLRMLMTLRLKSKYEVEAVSNGAEALKKCEEGGTDLIVTDIMMPVMDGYALVENLRSTGNLTPVIMLTAKDAMNDKGRGFAAGTDDYLTKPVNFEELTWRIDALLRRSKIANEGKITIGEVVVDKQSFTVTRGEISYELPTKEFQLLYLLLSVLSLMMIFSILLLIPLIISRGSSSKRKVRFLAWLVLLLISLCLFCLLF